MHDIRAIRDNPDAWAASASRRPSVDGKSVVAEVLALDAEVRAAILEKEQAEQARNAKSKDIGKAKAAKDETLAAQLMADVAAAKETIERSAKREAEATAKRDDILARLPNIPLSDVPEGADEHANKIVRVWDGAEKPEDHRPSGLRSGAKLNAPKDHADIGQALGLMDFEAAARMSGARFVVLKGQLARLERALTQFMLDVQTGENGYTEHQVPLLVKEHAMFGTGQLPKFEEDLFSTGGNPWPFRRAARKFVNLSDNVDKLLNVYRILLAKMPANSAVTPEQIADIDKAALDVLRLSITDHEHFIDMHEHVDAAERERKYLIPTAEVSLTNIVREQILAEAQLPMRMTAATPCFRSEAGSAGRDVKGMIRQHQFIKVELVSITKPEDSDEELKRMTGCAQTILERLDLPHRTMMLCTGDMGFGARKTFDIEVWLPSQNTYREISSCSTCGDFQARRMDAKFRREPTADNAKPKPEFVHTLNGSGLAVGRTLVAVLETYQREDGKVQVPKVLVPYMGGLEVIG